MNTPQTPYTINGIIRRRLEKKEEIRQSKERMQHITQELFAPQKSKTRIEGLMQHVNTGIAAYDGIMTGIKILHRIRKIFNRK